MRPLSIRRFEQAYLASAAVMAVNITFNFKAFADHYYDAGLAVGSVVVGMLWGAGLYFLVWFFIARRASTVTKWIFVALNAVGLINLVQFLASVGLISLPNTLTFLARLLLLAAAVFLLQRDAAEWLRTKGIQEPLDVTAFD